MASRHAYLTVLLDGLATVDEDVQVSGLSLDSRQVNAGDLFVALPGTQTQGHLYVDEAVAAGAVAILCDWQDLASLNSLTVPVIALHDLPHRLGVVAERFYGEPSSSLFMVGITGTNGKTSCAYFLAQAMNDEASPAAMIGTLGNGFPGQLAEASHTTPDAISLHGLLRTMLDQNAHSVAMEVSSHGLAQGRIDGVKFDVAVLTNLSRDHLDYHGDMQQYGAAKARLFTLDGLKYAVINGDDVFGTELLSRLPPSLNVVVYSVDDAACSATCVHGRVVAQGREGFTVEVSSPWGNGTFHTALLGRFNISNLLAVLSTLLIRGVAFDEALMRLEQLNTAPGRMQGLGGKGEQPLVVVDYAHTPDALQQVLETLREHCQARLWCVFGCGGDRDQGKRPQMGAIAVEYADQVIVTDDNPRHEDGQAIIDNILAGIHASPVEVIRDRAAAIRHAVSSAGRDDVVLVAGKGHEDYQQLADQRVPFSDIEQVQQALAVAA